MMQQEANCITAASVAGVPSQSMNVAAVQCSLSCKDGASSQSLGGSGRGTGMGVMHAAFMWHRFYR